MIKNHSRKGWFGASDTATIMGNWNTDTFRHFWLVKMGYAEGFGGNRYTKAGTAYEHKILDAIHIKKRDRQIRIKRLRLRVNLDGEHRTCIFEVKTHGKDEFKPCKAYWQQAQVEMFAAKKKLVIVAYRMDEENYDNYFLPIESGRITYHPIEYDAEWVKKEYLPRLRYLAYCLKKGVMPSARDFRRFEIRLQIKKANSILARGRRLFGRVREAGRKAS